MLQYPDNIGILDVTVTQRMVWPGVIQSHASGSEGRLSYANEPLWEFDLQYNGLHEGDWDGATYEELSKIEGLFGKCAGTTSGFKYKHPRWNATLAQSLGTTDGSTVAYDIVRTYGPASDATFQGTEHVGVLDGSVTFQLYIGGVPKTISDPTYGYTLSTTTPGKQQLVFNAAPPSGHAIAADFGYFFYSRFLESPIEYDKFADKLYEMKKVTLRTLRSEAL